MSSAIEIALRAIEMDAEACERDAERLKKSDPLNSYLMGCQAMAHRLDIQRIKQALNPTQKTEER